MPCHGDPVKGLRGIDAPSDTVGVRSRIEDLQLSAVDESTPTDSLAFNATIVDSEFGGRHVDVAVMVGETRLLSRISAGARGSWARKLEPGQPVTAFFHLQDVIFFDEAGKLIPRTAEQGVLIGA